MGLRRDARKLAVKVLYTADTLDIPFSEAWNTVDRGDCPERGVEFAEKLARGTLSRLEFIDGIIGKHTKNWESGRITNVDRAIIRLGLYEINFEDSIPRNASINEAVELAKHFSTSKSHRFVNGILDAASREKSV